jgi:glucose/mannose-6-phosphate isomerase
MLDDLKMIHERDAQDALGTAEKQWQQLQHEFVVNLSQAPEAVHEVVFAGMGGSALGALLALSWPGFAKPFEICRNYDIPSYVDSDTLFFASSYSGNTEETLSALEQAIEKQCIIVVITSGGKLAEIARERGYPLLLVPTGLQPRHAALYGLKALLSVTDAFGLTHGKAAELAAEAEFLKHEVAEWLPTRPTKHNWAKQIAQEIIGKSAVIYAGPKLAPTAYKWKISLNENAKHVAWTNQLPEFDHNEFIGWTKQPVDKPYAVIDLRSSFDHPRIAKRFVLAERLLSGMRPSPVVVNARGDTALQQLLSSIALGDFVSLYVALLNGVNPTPVDLIESFKQALDE